MRAVCMLHCVQNYLGCILRGYRECHAVTRQAQGMVWGWSHRGMRMQGTERPHTYLFVRGADEPSHCDAQWGKEGPHAKRTIERVEPPQLLPRDQRVAPRSSACWWLKPPRSQSPAR